LIPLIKIHCTKRKERNRFVLIFLSTLLLFTHITNANNFVHREGMLLKDSTGQTIQLRGVNLGGWLLWEGWMWGDGFKSQSKLMKRFIELAGQEKAEQFRDSVFQNLMSEDDLMEIAKEGFNIVRIPFNHRLFTFRNDSISENSPGWKIFDRIIGWCRKYKVYAVIDMHAAPGGQSPFFIADHTKNQLLWKSEVSRRKTVILWKAIARRYRDNPTVAGYDLLNESVPHKDRHLLELYKRIIAAVRETDPNHVVYLEGANFAKRFKTFKTLPDSNMAFSFHVYTWFGGDAAKKIKQYAALSKKLNVPVWCGEWGENKYNIILHTRIALENPENGFSGWCFWTWKRVHGRFPTLNEVNAGANWKKIMTWIQRRDHDRRPTTEETLLGMKEFLIACQSKNLVRDKSMFEVLSVLKKD
jgi:endoglucanase